MTTSKLTSLYIAVLLGTLLLTSVLSIPAHAKAVDPGEKQQGSELAGKPPTKTKRPRSTPRTATPRPSNTQTSQPPTQQSTSVAIATGTPLGMETAPATLVGTSLPTSTFSSEMNTVVTELTATSRVVQTTSTSFALTASSTPTSIGASTSTPSNLELTATSIVETTAPLQVIGQATATGSATPTARDNEIPIASQKSNLFLGEAGAVWIWGGGVVLFLGLVYMLRRELRKVA